ncbi:PAP_fibrillin [Cylindrospermum stagnale PCC 7417]|uniref:PAP_fibrillin n=1 Tax=Cylindrospermum stagnale PCC 7417 TaxID=56107 RepID=K9WS14_9NOST|nr:PAP/fibrillin family protein [Cylindrospermum stagnale]AFZ23008.1 PAP_fibrillin [Cylindrospermum stagnale PCC 7417]
MIIELANLKQELISICQSTNLGFNITPATKEQIETLAAKIEPLNPTAEPTNHIELLQGRWQLLYSTFSLEQETTLQRLSFGKLPNVKVNVTGIFQEIYPDGQQYINLIEFTGFSGVQGVALVSGRYTVENDKRLNIEFWETSVKSVNNDLSDSAFREALGVDNDSPLEAALSFSGWSDITYVDEDFRLMRGNQQNLYVLLRD